jgi:hypothetical protein
MNEFEANLLSLPVANLTNWLDVPAAIDYFIITEIAKNPGTPPVSVCEQGQCTMLQLGRLSICGVPSSALRRLHAMIARLSGRLRTAAGPLLHSYALQCMLNE